ncbi:MAG: ribulose-phosphate 3-epimerase [Microbacteriaceae bacterium]|jgi:ribulose-phosphate 3-epimerase|nr:ribulose-phosphate 3-epimerase [Microbacteriaceae bacterium]MCI1206753.1 ribulose-phosphate 3-epimerase [Microbacteriaceae bacterium]
MTNTPAVEISPSLLSADFGRLDRELEAIATADTVHVDVMDNHFVPNLTFGPPVVRRILQLSPVPLDVHLMIEDPDRWALEYAEMGCQRITFHAEASTAPLRLAAELRARGARAGIAVRPTTPITGLLPHLDAFDQVLVMTVEPGFGGQPFLSGVLPKLRGLAAEAPAGLLLQVDGGITVTTAPLAAEAGARSLVAGSSVYGTENPAAAIAALRASIR